MEDQLVLKSSSIKREKETIMTNDIRPFEAWFVTEELNKSWEKQQIFTNGEVKITKLMVFTK